MKGPSPGPAANRCGTGDLKAGPGGLHRDPPTPPVYKVFTPTDSLNHLATGTRPFTDEETEARHATDIGDTVFCAWSGS